MSYYFNSVPKFKPNKQNKLYKIMVKLLKINNSTYQLIDYIVENKTFSDKCFINGEIKIPIEEWNLKTEMGIVLDGNKGYSDYLSILHP